MKIPQNVRPTENYIFHNLSLARTQMDFFWKNGPKLAHLEERF
jgi:hypothetical protein